jgi:hypothetical protein
MATVEQIKQEIIDFHNAEIRKFNSDSDYEYDEAETFEDAFQGGWDTDGFYEDLYSGVDLPSGHAKKVKEWNDGDYGVTAIFSVGEQFFKINGSYSSWDGYEWYGKLVEVFPKEETKIRYYEKGKG